jgi:hypothetical protein
MPRYYSRIDGQETYYQAQEPDPEPRTSLDAVVEALSAPERQEETVAEQDRDLVHDACRHCGRDYTIDPPADGLCESDDCPSVQFRALQLHAQALVDMAHRILATRDFTLHTLNPLFDATEALAATLRASRGEG